MGTMSFGCDTMDEAVRQLDPAFGANSEIIVLIIVVVTISHLLKFLIRFNESCKTRLVQLATHGPDMSAQVRDVVLSPVCHKRSATSPTMRCITFALTPPSPPHAPSFPPDLDLHFPSQLKSPADIILQLVLDACQPEQLEVML
jgi:hypothetical protein